MYAAFLNINVSRVLAGLPQGCWPPSFPWSVLGQRCRLKAEEPVTTCPLARCGVAKLPVPVAHRGVQNEAWGSWQLLLYWCFCSAPTVPRPQEKTQLGVCTPAKEIPSQTLLLLAASFGQNVGQHMLAQCSEQWPRQLQRLLVQNARGSCCPTRKTQARAGAPGSSTSSSTWQLPLLPSLLSPP